MRHGIISAIDLDLEKASWLKTLTSTVVFHNANIFGGFIRIIEKVCNSLFIPEGRNDFGINCFLSGITRAITLMIANTTKEPMQAIEYASCEVLLGNTSAILIGIP
ncbi:unnamed protein product [Cuscuta europaea]|uniref:Uncharacterized protein n=1 Tax=Cuscuta europaea TaxID=41803 RepID=A0A9P1EG67_CUSEU|nr:unnamed protein product [Cuscuta europaea]